MASLEGHPDFEAIREYLKQCLNDLQVNSATTKDEVVLRWQQGGIQVLSELISRAGDARELTYKLQRKQRP